MNTNLSFQKTIAGSLKSRADVHAWDTVLHLYETAKYAEAIRESINFIDPEIEKKFANPERTAYHIPHGSIIVNLNITHDQFIVSAPFLDITNSKQIPILRQVSQLNFTPLMLSRIELEGDQLYFKFECPLDLCEPYKIYDVLREICINADNYDDEFISKFDAVRIQQPQIYPYTDEQKLTAWNTTQQYIKEAFEAYDVLENKRLTSYLWDILIITLLKIDYFCAPQGKLRNEIEKTFLFLISKEDYYQRLSDGKEFLKKLQVYDRSKFENDLYRIEVFMPYKFRANLDSVRNGLRYAYETAGKEIKALDYIGAALTLEYGILNFFYTNSMDDAITEVLTAAMENASLKPMTEASSILFEAVEKIMTMDNFTNSSTSIKNIRKTEEVDKGFFKRLFGA
ncbi:MAG: hypothetical protein JWN78_2985 [Bacteroidota bacterium]|nr:hypothetical protein [Bacteroidota bacterium]